MRRSTTGLPAAWAGLLLAWILAAPAHAGGPAKPPSAVAADPEVALRRGMDFERLRRWPAAIEAYQGALEQWPDKAEFRQRLRLCEIHQKVARRYQDKSFRDVLLALPADRTLDLYDEVLERIADHYFETVAVSTMLRRGLDNLDVALRDTAFLQVNCPTADPSKIVAVRDALRRRRQALVAADREGAHAEIRAACDLARRGLELPSSPVILEFIYGAAESLDDYSNYLTPDRLDDLFAMIDGNFVGLGVELKADDAGLRLVGVIRGGPAAEAGLRVGDKITHVAGQPMKGLGLDDAANRLQGTEGTPVEVVVAQVDGASRQVKLVRRAVEVQSVAQAKIVEPRAGIGYIQLNGFQKSSTEEIRRAIDALNSRGMRHLVLDLRGNPGGLLNVVVDIAEGFLDSGTIVTTRGRARGQSATHRATASAPWRMPMTVLIDHDSASASEILAGALKENGRAYVMGERSYGKGSVQSIFPLRTAPAGLKLTTAKFYSPRDMPYSDRGVTPDEPIVAHAAAKPGGDASTYAEPGDVATDVVLRAAIRRAAAP